MATAFYLYEKMSDYMKFYPSGQDLVTEMPAELISRFNGKLWIIIEQMGLSPKPSSTKSIEIVYSGKKQYAKFSNNGDVKVMWIKLDFKTNMMYFDERDKNNSKKVDRFVGDNIQPQTMLAKLFRRRLTFLPEFIFYDSMRNRINIILDSRKPDIPGSVLLK